MIRFLKLIQIQNCHSLVKAKFYRQLPTTADGKFRKPGRNRGGRRGLTRCCCAEVMKVFALNLGEYMMVYLGSFRGRDGMGRVALRQGEF